MKNELRIIENTFEVDELEKIISHLNGIDVINEVNDKIYNYYGLGLSLNAFGYVISKYIQHGLLILETQIETFRLQKIDNTIECGDNFYIHNDDVSLGVVTFLNDDFEGGLFEYKIGGEVKSIKPTKNTTLFFDSSIPHRVTNVNGARITLALFLRPHKEHKNNKTLI